MTTLSGVVYAMSTQSKSNMLGEDHMKTMRKWIPFILAGVLCFAAAVPVQAAASSDLGFLFSEGLNPTENYVTVRDYDEEDGEYYEPREIDLISRKTRGAISVNKNVRLDESVKLTVSKNTTMTVKEGVTLTILGELVVEGTLVNKGTIVLGVKESPLYEGFGDAYELADIGKLAKRLTITNKGTIRNEGTMQILNGFLVNNIGKTIENSGTLSVANTVKDSVGIRNPARIKEGVAEYATLLNSGKILLKNTSGTGLHNFNGAKVENSGEITLAKRATYKGKISGNQPVSA
jgi:hypothetical protein